MQNSYTWYSNTTPADSPDTIHQILALGTLKDIQEVKNHLGEEKVRDLFIQYPKKIYTRSGLNFIMKFILHIHQPIHEDKYLNSTPRNIK